MARKTVREADVREEAPMREAPVRADARAPEGLTRGRKDQSDKFHIASSIVKRFEGNGWSLEWKRHTVYGQEDPSHQMELAENHWQPVMDHEANGFTPKGYTGPIIRDGLMLMKRPMYLTVEARRENEEEATARLRRAKEQLAETPPGTLTRDHPTARPQTSRSYEPITVPQD